MTTLYKLGLPLFLAAYFLCRLIVLTLKDVFKAVPELSDAMTIARAETATQRMKYARGGAQ